MAVVGHLEWVTFGNVDRVPAAGSIAHATGFWEQPAGGGAVAAVQLARLNDSCHFFTAVGEDDLGKRSIRELEALGLTVHAAVRREPTRRGFAMVDPSGERTIVTFGNRLDPRGDDPLPWELLLEAAGVYVTAGDGDAFRAARRSRAMVVTSRALELLAASGVRADALVGSAGDPAERFDPTALEIGPGLVVRTEGVLGGSFTTADGAGRYPPSVLPGPVVDTYGCGDSFAAGLTFGLSSRWTLEDSLALAARCGASCISGKGPYGAQLTSADLPPGRPAGG